MRQADGTWVQADRLSGPGQQVEALRRVSRHYYGLGQFLVFRLAQWNARVAS